MIPSSKALFAAAASTSLLLHPALASSSSHPDPEMLRAQNINSNGPVQWHQTQDAAAHAALRGDQVNQIHETDEDERIEGKAPAVTVSGSTTSTPEPEGTLLDWQPELRTRRSEDGGEERRTVLLGRETSAAPTIYGVSIWLILAWLALLYLMYKTGSL